MSYVTVTCRERDCLDFDQEDTGSPVKEALPASFALRRKNRGLESIAVNGEKSRAYTCMQVRHPLKKAFFMPSRAVSLSWPCVIVDDLAPSAPRKRADAHCHPSQPWTAGAHQAFAMTLLTMDTTCEILVFCAVQSSTFQTL